MLNVGSSELKNKRILGIIAEYNPFHFGHAYQLQTLREKVAADVVVVLMSGNVVQRGEFAIIDKWARAEAAMELGADLVLESPIFASLQSADYFASHHVQILSDLKVDVFGFGTESADEASILEYLQWHQNNLEAINQEIQGHLAMGLSYPASYQGAIDALAPTLNFDTTSPNHLLGIQYVAYNQTLETPMDFVTLPRIYQWQGNDVHSGSDIRKCIDTNGNDTHLVPEAMARQLKNATLMNWSKAYPYLRYRLAQHTPQSLNQIRGVREGLEFLILRAAKETKDYNGLISRLVSKRWSKASIQRILMAILLDFTTDVWQQLQTNYNQQRSVQVLGFNQAGREHLNEIKHKTSLNMISNMNQKTALLFQGNLRADEILEVIQAGRIAEQNFTKFPIVKTNKTDK